MARTNAEPECQANKALLMGYNYTVESNSVNTVWLVCKCIKILKDPRILIYLQKLLPVSYLSLKCECLHY